MAYLLVEVLLPHHPDMGVGFRHITGIIEIALGIFMLQQIFQPGAPGVQQTAVLGDVLFLDHADFLIKPAAQVVGVKGAQIHIVVHGLLFGGGDDLGVELGQGVRRGEIHERSGVVLGEAVLGYGGPAGHNLGVAAHQKLGPLAALVHLQQVGVAVQMVKILQQGEIQGGFYQAVRFGLRHARRQVHRQLLIADGGFQRRFVHWLQGLDTLLLLLLGSADQSQLPPQRFVWAISEKLVGEKRRFHLGAVHQNHSTPRVGVYLIFVVRIGV